MQADQQATDRTPLFVYMTAGDDAEATRIARTLVAERLAACVNRIDGMRSVYRWRDQVEEATEIVLIAKTTRDSFDALCALVRALHSYDTPCIVAMPLVAGDRPFMDWIAQETAG